LPLALSPQLTAILFYVLIFVSIISILAGIFNIVFKG